MSDQNQDIVAEFAVESQEHLADIENELLAIERNGADLDVELVNKVFRSVHSIKGASGFLGFATVGALAHSLENVLNLLRNRELVPNSSMTDVLLRAADALRGLISNLEISNDTDISAHIAALGEIITGQTAPEAQGNVDATLEFRTRRDVTLRTSRAMLDAQHRVGNRVYALDVDLIGDVEDRGRTPLDLVKDILTYGELLDAQMSSEGLGSFDEPAPEVVSFSALVGSVLEDPAMLAEALEVDAACVSCPSRVDESGLSDAKPDSAPASDRPLSSVQGQDLVHAAASSSPAKAASNRLEPAAGPSPKPTATAQADTSVRVSVGLLDRLMNLAGELVLGRNQLLQMIARRDQQGLESVGGRVDQVTSELQEAIMQARMQPIGSVFNKLPRIVRDLGGKLGKKCELVVEGNEVELDKSLLEAITDPLTHLIRNSIDHGIELPESRIAAGKPAHGTLLLKAFHQAGKVNILISDDGKGIDPAVVKAKAVEKGILTSAQARDLGDGDAVKLIFAAGFSTAAQVTDVSGRGVGMDVVRTNIEKAGGTVDIESEPGSGTTVRIRLPLTLAIIPSLIVRCGTEQYALPQVGISELVRIKASDARRRIERVSNAEVLRLRGALLPLVRLSTALNVQSKYPEVAAQSLEDNDRINLADRRAESPSRDDELERRGAGDRRGDTPAGALNIVVVETGQLRYGLVVDGLHDSEEIVVKPLGSHVKGVPCLAGTTILGDGRVALILDVAGIATHCRLTQPRDADTPSAATAATKEARELQTMLLFTNDPAEHFAIPMGLISRIERIRSDLIDRVGGQEVLQYRGNSLALLSLERYVTALPRPVQDTLYVVVFRIARQEVGLIVPKLVDIREVAAELDIVTFREPAILGSMVVDSHATRVLDLAELVGLAKPEWLAEETSRNAQRCGYRVLLAEDSAFFRKQVEAFLQAEGYEVISCEDGAAAWEALQEADPPVDLVVTDIEMPNLDGYGLTRQIRNDARFARLPVIAVTSLAGQEDMDRGKAAGVDDYQIKLDRDRLLEALVRYTGGPPVQR